MKNLETLSSLLRRIMKSTMRKSRYDEGLVDEQIDIEINFLEFYLPYILNSEYDNDFDEYYWKYLKEFGVKDSIEFINFVRDKFVNFIKRCRKYYGK